MIFNSMQFWMFFLFIAMIVMVIPGKWRVTWLLLTSYYFYMCWKPGYALLLAFSTITTYATGLILENKKEESIKKRIVAGCCILNLGLLFFFKYFNFTIESADWFLKKLGVGAIDFRLDLLLPVGISFYTFQAIGYIVDVYRGQKAEHDIRKYALFVSFFPQLGSGPIERARNILVQLDEFATKKMWDYDRIKNGLLLFLWGLFQKTIVADRIALYVDTVYGNYTEYGLTVISVAIVLYAFQIYCDFDGYTNMACGIAQVLGIELIKNFKRPYFATNIKEFWSRWHISLTSWFRDYLYIPLGGNRKGKIRQNINVLIVFCVSGLWHGASWNFIIWGFMHGIMQVIHNLYSKIVPKKKESFSSKLRNGIITFGVVDLAWLFFRTSSVTEAMAILKQMFCMLGDFSAVLEVIGTGDRNLMLLGLMIVFLVDFVHEKGIGIRAWISQQEMWFRYILYAGIICACLYFGVHSEMDAARNFIYFQF